MWKEALRIIGSHRRFLVTTHSHPDGDGVGASIALIELLRALDKEARLVLDSPLPNRYRFLDQRSAYERYDPEADYGEVEVMIVLDTHRRERIGGLATLLNLKPDMVVLCIDHHPITQTFTPHIIIDESACSVGAMIFALSKEYGYTMNLLMAMGIYASIMCDTGRFSYGTTSRTAHKIADECLRVGVDPDLMYSRLFQSVALAQFKMFVRALQRMETFFDNRVVILQIYCEDYADLRGDLGDIDQIDFEFIHEFNKSIIDVECVALLTQEPQGKIRISARSKTDVDVGEMMQTLGGGGHRYAAGATVAESPERMKEKILLLIEPYLNKSKIDEPCCKSR